MEGEEEEEEDEEGIDGGRGGGGNVRWWVCGYSGLTVELLNVVGWGCDEMGVKVEGGRW